MLNESYKINIHRNIKRIIYFIENLISEGRYIRTFFLETFVMIID